MNEEWFGSNTDTKTNSSAWGNRRPRESQPETPDSKESNLAAIKMVLRANEEPKGESSSPTAAQIVNAPAFVPPPQPAAPQNSTAFFSSTVQAAPIQPGLVKEWRGFGNNINTAPSAPSLPSAAEIETLLQETSPQVIVPAQIPDGPLNLHTPTTTSITPPDGFAMQTQAQQQAPAANSPASGFEFVPPSLQQPAEPVPAQSSIPEETVTIPQQIRSFADFKKQAEPAAAPQQPSVEQPQAFTFAPQPSAPVQEQAVVAAATEVVQTPERTALAEVFASVSDDGKKQFGAAVWAELTPEAQQKFATLVSDLEKAKAENERRAEAIGKTLDALQQIRQNDEAKGSDRIEAAALSVILENTAKGDSVSAVQLQTGGYDMLRKLVDTLPETALKDQLAQGAEALLLTNQVTPLPANAQNTLAQQQMAENASTSQEREIVAEVENFLKTSTSQEPPSFTKRLETAGANRGSGGLSI